MEKPRFQVSVGAGPIRFYGPLPGAGILAGLIIGLLFLLCGWTGWKLHAPVQPTPTPAVSTSPRS